MAYTTAAKAAALAGDEVAEGDIQAEWLTWADEIIDRWRGDRYPPTADAQTVNIDGTGSDTIFLPVSLISGVSAVSVEGSALDSSAYAWYRAGYIRRKTTDVIYLSPYLVQEEWPEGVQNIEVTFTPVAYSDLLDLVAAQIVAKIAIFSAQGGALKSGGFQVGDYSERGGTYFGNAGLDGDIQEILERLLPMGDQWANSFQ